MGATVFEVFIKPEKRPTFAAFNAALAKHGYPMRVLPAEGQQDSDLLKHDAHYMLETRVVVDGEEHTIFLEEMSVERNTEGAEETNERLEECGSPFRVTDDDHVMITSFGVRIARKYLVPGVLMNVIMILEFDGYGFDGEEMTFGREDYAKEMLRWIAPYPNAKESAPPKAPITPQATPPAPAADAAPVPAQKGKFRWTFWRVLFAVVALMFVAEFVDKNIYNFTGTGG